MHTHEDAHRHTQACGWHDTQACGWHDTHPATGFNNGSVIHKPHNRVLSMSGIAVVGVQREQEGAEHTALGVFGVEH